MFLREPTAAPPLSLFSRAKRQAYRTKLKSNGGGGDGGGGSDSITEPNSIKRNKHSHMKNRSSSSTHLIEKDETNYKEQQINSTKHNANEIEMTSTTSTVRQHATKYKKFDSLAAKQTEGPH